MPALWFGEPNASLFGWFHPAAPRARDVVVVLCNPFGYDVPTTHYAYQKLAERLSRAGVASMRFDYFGTGDSAGDDEGPHRLEAWIDSIDAAVAKARELSGASQVVLFGARLGALLATIYAQAKPVDGLLLFGPPRSGSAFVREVLAFNKMRTTSPTEGASPDIEFPDDENLGFPFPPDLREALSDLDPRADDARPAPRALVIGRDDIVGVEDKLVEHLQSIGVDVQHSHAGGYKAVFTFKDIPIATTEEILDWLPKEERKKPEGAPGATTATIDGVTEELVRFGGLFGVLTLPPEGTPVRDTGMLLLGTGAHWHVGVGRLNVTFARELAKLGFRSLRFDLSGIGESPTLAGEPDRFFYTVQAVPETRAAIDYMVSRGPQQVALAGICSGGYTAFHTSVNDKRVSAIIPINVPAYHLNVVDSMVLAADRPNARQTITAVALSRIPLVGRRYTLLDDQDDIGRAYGKLLARKCRILVVNGSGDVAVKVLEQHLGPGLAKLKGDEQITVTIVNGTDHTFTPRIAQRRLRALVTEFCARELR